MVCVWHTCFPICIKSPTTPHVSIWMEKIKILKNNRWWTLTDVYRMGSYVALLIISDVGGITSYGPAAASWLGKNQLQQPTPEYIVLDGENFMVELYAKHGPWQLKKAKRRTKTIETRTGKQIKAVLNIQIRNQHYQTSALKKIHLGLTTDSRQPSETHGFRVVRPKPHHPRFLTTSSSAVSCERLIQATIWEQSNAGMLASSNRAISL